MLEENSVQPYLLSEVFLRERVHIVVVLGIRELSTRLHERGHLRVSFGPVYPPIFRRFLGQ